jgi:hypothetical protein
MIVLGIRVHPASCRGGGRVPEVTLPGVKRFRYARLARIALPILLLGLMALPLASCAGGPKRTKMGEAARMLRDQAMTRAQLEELSNAFADRYFTLMLAASERVLRDNTDMQQRRIMNGLRLLGVSSMYDIATSPDTLTQLVDQLVVVTLQNFFWVDSGRSQAIWGEERAQALVENLRKAREDIWGIAAKVFTDEQLEELDLLISTWWTRRGGTEFVAYVRFSEVASVKGEQLIQTVRDGGGLLEPLDRAIDQAEEAKISLERTFFWAKRLPLFANWQAEALALDLVSLPETELMVGNIDDVATTFSSMPDRIEQLMDRMEGTQQTLRDVVDMLFWRALGLVGAITAALLILTWYRSKRRIAP